MQSRRPVAQQSKLFSRQKRTRFTILSVAVVVIVSSGIFVMSRLSYLSVFTIQVIEVRGAGQDIIGSVRAAAEESLKGDYLNLFSRSNVFLYSKSDVVKSTMTASPRIEGVEVKRNKLTGITISVKEKEAGALVCQTFPDFDEGKLALDRHGACLLADASGLLYEQVASSSVDGYNLYYAPAAKEVATSTEEFKALQEFYAGMKKSNIAIQAILFKDKGEYEAYVKGSDKDDRATTVIYFNNTRPLSLELENLILFWNHALEVAKPKGRIPVYEYVDVRYGSNIFFREVK